MAYRLGSECSCALRAVSLAGVGRDGERLRREWYPQGSSVAQNPFCRGPKAVCPWGLLCCKWGLLTGG